MKGWDCRAYDRGGSHALLWDTAETDPGQSLNSHLVIGDTVVAWSSDRVNAYRMSDIPTCLSTAGP